MLASFTLVETDFKVGTPWFEVVFKRSYFSYMFEMGKTGSFKAPYVFKV
jgi:hypothetical protein